jgi:hypothetical protein
MPSQIPQTIPEMAVALCRSLRVDRDNPLYPTPLIWKPSAAEWMRQCAHEVALAFVLRPNLAREYAHIVLAHVASHSQDCETYDDFVAAVGKIDLPSHEPMLAYQLYRNQAMFQFVNAVLIDPGFTPVTGVHLLQEAYRRFLVAVGEILLKALFAHLSPE